MGYALEKDDGEMAPQARLDEKAVHALGSVFWNLVAHWEISQKDQALLLGVKFHATKLSEWQRQKIIPQDPDKFNRVGFLVGIHKNLRILFPYNRQAVYRFMTTPQKELFGGKTALQVIREGGEMNSYASIAAIRRRLDQLRV